MYAGTRLSYCRMGIRKKDGCFFFFKQKTAYEMRIRDWSSDVCSSDLYGTVDEANAAVGLARLHTAALDDPEIDAILGRIQNDLFDLGADLATPEVENPKYPPLRIVSEQVERLEGEIDRLNAGQIGRAHV